MTRQEMEVNFLRLEVLNAKSRISFLLEATENLSKERERLIAECERYIEEIMMLRKTYGILSNKEKE